jgi:hypothetical protein
MDRSQALRFATDWIAAWNSHDLDRILAHYAEDVELTSPAVQQVLNDPSGRVVGKAALRAYWRTALEQYPELLFELHRVLPGVNSVVLYYRSINDLLAAETMEFDTKGRVCRVLAHYTPE